MGSFSNFMRGNVACTITAPFPERVLNLCALSHLMFWGLEWHSPTSISIHLSAKEVKRLAPIVDQLGGNISAQRGHGLPFFLLKFRHRLGFLVGLSLSVFAVAVLSNFILVIDVEGNEQISTADILSALERAGLSVGVYGPHLSLTQLQQEAMTYLDGVSWLSVNRNGTRAEVTVRESTIPPEIQSRDGVFDILSDVDGIIQSIELHRGEPLVVVGETVTKGQPLVSGYTELPAPLYSEQPPQWLPVHASALITARTWRTLTAITPLGVEVKTVQAQSTTAYQLDFLSHQIGLFSSDNPPSTYDKIKTTTRLTQGLPLTFSTIKQSSFTLAPTTIMHDAARQMLEQSLLNTLQEIIGDKGELVSHEFVVRITGDMIEVTMTAECLEEIGYTSPSPPLSLELEEQEISHQ